MTEKTIEKELGHDGYPLWQVFKETAEKLGWPLEEFAPSGLDQYYQLVKAGYDHALSLLQWKDVADGLPKVEGKYLVQMKQFNGATVADYAERHRDSWLEYVVAYVPMKITEYEKQETTKL